jgi:integrase
MATNKATRRAPQTGSVFRPGGTRSKRPYRIAWTDHTGRRQVENTHVNDQAVARRMLDARISRTRMLQDGIVDADTERRMSHGKRPLVDHVEEYLGHCKHSGHAKQSIAQKRCHLRELLEQQSLYQLPDLTPEALERYLIHRQIDRDDSARTWNYIRQNVNAFANWCVKQGRMLKNPLSVVPKKDEQADRRKVRRPLTRDELNSLFDVARERGRLAWYACAYYAGLRKGDMQKLCWSDVDFKAMTLTIRQGKAKRVDVLSVHPTLATILGEQLEQAPAIGSAKVFRTAVTDATRRRDFERAGIPHTDEDGHTADLHALRTTLGTDLARNGVAPQIAQKIMRHANYQTTLQHYTVLGLTDTAAALAQLPDVLRSVAMTGTDGTSPAIAPVRARGALSGAIPCNSAQDQVASPGSLDGTQPRTPCDVVQSSTTLYTKAGDAIRTRDIQLGRLTLYH